MKHLKKISFYSMPGLSLMVLSACLPTDDALTKSDGAARRSYSGFTGVSAVQTVDESKLKVSWTPTSDPAVVAYNIYDASNFFTPELLGTAVAPTNSIVLNSANGIQSQKFYNIRVRAANRFNIEDDNSKQLPGIPYGGISSINVVSATEATINYNSVSEAEAALIYCKEGVNGTFALKKTESDTARTSTNITGLTPGVSYFCRVRISMNATEDNNTVTQSFTPIGQADTLLFTTQPGSANAGSPFSPQPEVTIYDVNGNIVSAGPDSTAQITLILTADSIGTIIGTASMQAQGGVARFNGLKIQEAGVKNIIAKKISTAGQVNGSGEMLVTSNPFTISPGSVSPTLSSISISPASGTLTTDLSPSYSITTVLKDQYGNFITGVKPQFVSTTNADTISQPLVNTDVNGLTTGSIASPVAGTRTLSIASPAGLSTVAIPVEFLHGSATKVKFTSHPVNSSSGPNNINNVVVRVQDAQGNTVTTGPSATATIGLAVINNVNGANLLGTASKPAVAGEALFNGLGLDKTGTGYKFSANASGLVPAQSNSFNVTAGVPEKILISGAATVKSGVCANNQVIVQLQDNGGNPANAPFTMSFNLSGLGSGSFYTSSLCSGSPIANPLSFSVGSSTKTLYYKNNAAELATITATDVSGVVPSHSHDISSLPAKVILTGPTSVTAGACSTAFTVTTQGENGNTGPVATNTDFQINGLGTSTALFYATNDCSGPTVNTSAVTVPGGASSTNVYFKGTRAESLTLSIYDPAENISPVSAPINFIVLPSKINFTGPTSVVSGQCSTTPYNIALKDAENNTVVANAATTLKFNGLTGAARFYTTSNCSGGGINTTFAVPQGSSSVNLYFSNTAAGITTVFISDPALKLAVSQSIQISVSPSNFLITAPVIGQAKTNVCSGPFTVTTRDGAGTQTPAITAITANLGGKGIAGNFHPDATCSNTAISLLNFAAGESSKQFYFRSYFPATLSLSATDNAGVLATANAAWTITPALGWIGTQPGTLSWFEQGKFPAGARFNYAEVVRSMTFGTSKRYLYVVDDATDKLIKYDYLNQSYVGWVGALNKAGAIGAEGSIINGSLNAQCSGLLHGAETPGWCFGGQSMAEGGSFEPGKGSLYDPADVTVGITNGVEYVYVANYSSHVVSRFRADTGTFSGWIGRITGNDTPNGPAPGLSNTCGSLSGGAGTPGWCMGGGATYLDRVGTAGFIYPRLVAFSASAAGGPFLLVGESRGIKRFNAETGQFMGWIGRVDVTPTSAATDVTNSCAGTGNGAQTPGWCIGGTLANIGATAAGSIYDPNGLYVDDANGKFYVTHAASSGIIAVYDLASGAFEGHVRNGTAGGVTALRSARNLMIEDGLIYLADWYRVVKMDLSGTIYGWIGKVGNNASMSGTGCSGLDINDNTPGWCLGGTEKAGVDEPSFSETNTVISDGNGKLLTADYRTPWIKRWDTATGAYEGQLILEAKSPKRWSIENAQAGREGYDDNSIYRSYGVHHDGGFIYVAEYEGSRVKKINAATGETLGWIGGITSKPTGGTDPSCLLANAMSISPSWCLGAWLNPQFLWNTVINSTVDGLMYSPIDVTTDTTWLYVIDHSLHRISRFDKTSGAYGGWIGQISTKPNGGAAGCNGATGFTPGWCLGGYPTSNYTSGTGGLYYPRSITYANGVLYVFDQYDRVNSYLASSGAFMGWTGMINATPTGSMGGTNCGGTYGQVTGGWCVGGTSLEPGINGASPVAGSFRDMGSNGLAVDSNYLYVSNGYFSRIDRFNFQGQYVDSLKVNWTVLNSEWTNLTGSGAPFGWDGYRIYQLEVTDDAIYGSYANIAVKYDKVTGNVLGWQGAINPGNSPTSPGACVGATGITPTWCKGGAVTDGFTPGGFVDSNGITSDGSFVYVSDQANNRITRLPK